jgi:peptide/nickel transport system ATP-binding protein
MSKSNLPIHISVAGRTIVAIRDFSFPADKITFLFGESGIGKSMLSKAVYGLLDADELQITIHDKNYAEYLRNPFVKKIKEQGFFVFQEPSSHLNSLLTLQEQLREGSLSAELDEQAILRHLWDSTPDESIRALLDVYPKPYRPSGGEKQRILLAMAFKKINAYIAQKESAASPIFIFDEPTGSLDNHFRNRFLDLLFQKYQQKPFTVLLITHDYSIISEIYERHPGMLENIAFKELSRRNMSQVELHDFSADSYRHWLRKLEESTPYGQEGEQTAANPVLQVQSGFRIFQRQLRLYRDAGCTQETDLKIYPGQMIYLKAGSGVGKTTLAKIIMGLLPAQKLRMQVGGMQLTEQSPSKLWRKKIWGKKAGMVFQHADEALNLQATVKESLEGLKTKKLRGQFLKDKLTELFEESVDTAFLRQKVALLSGGQKQRLNLLRTLVLDVDLVILDEPLNGLDFVSIRKVLQWLDEKRRQQKAFLMISHNEEIFEHIIDPRHTYYLKAVEISA